MLAGSNTCEICGKDLSEKCACQNAGRPSVRPPHDVIGLSQKDEDIRFKVLSDDDFAKLSSEQQLSYAVELRDAIAKGRIMEVSASSPTPKRGFGMLADDS